MIDLAEELEISMDRSDLKFQLLVKSVTNVYREAVGHIVEDQRPYLELNVHQFDPEAIPARIRLLTHYRKILFNIMRWRKFSNSLFGIDDIATTLVQDVMLPIADSGWDVGGREAMREVAALFPPGTVPPKLLYRLQ